MGGPKDSTGPPEPALESAEGAVIADTEAARPTFTVLEALSASGLRALRYVKEVHAYLRWSRASQRRRLLGWQMGRMQVDGVDVVIANDLDANAVKAIANNVQRNEIPSGKEVAWLSMTPRALFAGEGALAPFGGHTYDVQRLRAGRPCRRVGAAEPWRRSYGDVHGAPLRPEPHP